MSGRSQWPLSIIFNWVCPSMSSNGISYLNRQGSESRLLHLLQSHCVHLSSQVWGYSILQCKKGAIINEYKKEYKVYLFVLNYILCMYFKGIKILFVCMCMLVYLCFSLLYVVDNWFPVVDVLSSRHRCACPFAQPSYITTHDLHAVFVFANHTLLFQQDLQHQNMAVHLIKVLIELNGSGNEQMSSIKSKESEQAN